MNPCQHEPTCPREARYRLSTHRETRLTCGLHMPGAVRELYLNGGAVQTAPVN